MRHLHSKFNKKNWANFTSVEFFSPKKNHKMLLFSKVSNLSLFFEPSRISRNKFKFAKFRGRPTTATVDLPFKDIVQVFLIGPSIGFAGLLLTHMVGMRGVGDPSTPSPSTTVRDTSCQPGGGGGGGHPEPVFLNVYGGPESIPRNEFRQPM